MALPLDQLRWCVTLDDFVTIYEPASDTSSWVRQGPALIQVDNNSLCLAKDFVLAAQRARQVADAELMRLEDDLSLLVEDPCVELPDDEFLEQDEPASEMTESSLLHSDSDDELSQPASAVAGNSNDDDNEVSQIASAVVGNNDDDNDEVIFLKTQHADDVQYIKTITPRRKRKLRASSMILRSQTRLRRSKRVNLSVQ